MKITAIILGIAALVGVLFMSQQGESDIFSTATVPTPRRGSAVFYLSPQSARVSTGKQLSVEVKMVTDELTLSAAAIRVLYTYTDDLPLVAIDADAKRDGIQAKINPELIDAGWSVPINKVTVDDNAKTVTFDVALINLSVGGYTTSGDVALATIDFAAKAKSAPLTFDFSSDDTKLVTKQGSEVYLDLQEANYKVRSSFIF